MRDSIFISYSHTDSPILDELRCQLSSTLDAAHITTWDDTQIGPSTRWRSEIVEALSTSAAAVVLLSPSFFASDFITTHELPALLKAAERSELKILPIILTQCQHELITATYQAVNDPARPLETLDEPSRQEVWVKLITCLRDVDSTISDENRIAAETKRLENDIAMVPAVITVNDKIGRARVDSAFDENELYRENTLVFLEGQRCQEISTWLIEQFKLGDITKFRSKAIVRMMKQIASANEQALKRASELTQQLADDAHAMLNDAKGQAVTDDE